jgi:hypothetical protein
MALAETLAVGEVDPDSDDKVFSMPMALARSEKRRMECLA